MRQFVVRGSAVATWLVCAPLIVPGCAPADGEVVFGVTTEIPAGLVLTRVETTLTVDGSAVASTAYDGADLDFPFEVATGELPEGSRVELQLDAFQGAELIVARTAATTIVSDRKLLLELALEDECEGVDCGASETCIGGTCLEPFEDPSSLQDYYEKWAGGGYPRGLVGEAIPLEGRIAAVADVFDALTSARPYKRAWTIPDSVAHLEAGAGEHFDPNLVSLFLGSMDDVMTIRHQFAD